MAGGHHAPGAPSAPERCAYPIWIMSAPGEEFAISSCGNVGSGRDRPPLHQGSRRFAPPDGADGGARRCPPATRAAAHQPPVAGATASSSARRAMVPSGRGRQPRSARHPPVRDRGIRRRAPARTPRLRRFRQPPSTRWPARPPWDAHRVHTARRRWRSRAWHYAQPGRRSGGCARAGDHDPRSRPAAAASPRARGAMMWPRPGAAALSE